MIVTFRKISKKRLKFPNHTLVLFEFEISHNWSSCEHDCEKWGIQNRSIDCFLDISNIRLIWINRFFQQANYFQSRSKNVREKLKLGKFTNSWYHIRATSLTPSFDDVFIIDFEKVQYFILLSLFWTKG